MSMVIIRRAEYDYSTLRPVFFAIMDSITGDLIKKDCRVIIKPNLLAPASPDKAIVTHPLVIKAAVEYVIHRGAVPRISDSPASGSFEKILKVAGIRAALEGLRVDCREFKKSAFIDVGEPFKKIEIARDALDADVVINLPKLKTHTQMLLTLGVKNLFGCVVGMRKPEWHLRAGVDREMFARLLLKVYQAVKPSVTVIDSILAMEGQGPGKRGKPRDLGVLMGSSDAVALDNVVCRMIGIASDKLLTNKIAVKEGLLSKEINIDGDLPTVMDFKLPEMAPLVFGPKMFHGFMRRHLIQRPECNDSDCRLCAECWQYCPVEAITHDEKKLHFDYEKCIRCYCCIEICPHGALSANETLTGKVARKLFKIQDY